MKRSLLVFILLLFCPVGPAFAQSGNTQNSLLPEIDPQDIEIRSEFRARFPGIRRQPILGFNPKPRIFRIDPNRTPFMESDKDAVASIVLTQLDRPTPPQKIILQKPPRTRAFIKAGFGTFITPEIEAYALHRLHENSIASANLDFSSSDGHLNNQDSGFRFLNIDGVYGTRLNNGAKFSVKASAFSDFNHLFDLSANVPNDNSGTAKKEYQGASAGFILENNSNALEGWEFYLNGTLIGIDLKAPNTALRGNQSEQFVQSGFKKTWAGSDIYDVFTATINVKGGNYSAGGAGDTQWINSSATFGYSSLFNYVTKIKLEGGIGFLSDGFRSKPLFISEASMNHGIQDNINLIGSVYTRPEIKSMSQHHQTNRFLNANSQTRYQYVFGIDAGLEFSPIPSTMLFGSFSFQSTDNYAFYARTTQTFGANQEQTFYGINYATVSTFRVEMGVTQKLVNNKIWFDGLLYAQRPELKTGGDVPFEERLGAEGAFNIRIADPLIISSWAQFKGERENPANTSNLNGYILVNGELNYKINEKFGVYFKVLNILGEKYELWEGYEERPFQVFGGIKLTL